MFNLFGRKRKSCEVVSVGSDSLSRTATQIAVEVIYSRGGVNYLKGMKRIFRATPGLIDEVSPRYRDRLKQILQAEEHEK